MLQGLECTFQICGHELLHQRFAENSDYLQYWFSASSRLLQAQCSVSCSLKPEFWQCSFLHFPSLVDNFREGGRWWQCLHRSGNTSNQSRRQICQICSKHEDDIARREFWFITARHQLVLRLFQMEFITCLSILRRWNFNSRILTPP